MLRYLEPIRAKRIRNQKRMIAKARRAASLLFEQPCNQTYYIDRDGINRPFATWKDVFNARDVFARRYHDHLKVCSCWMCGNPRKYYNSPTIQECRAYESAKDQFEERGLRFKAWRFSKSKR